MCAGRPVAFPTETVYGLGADALDAAAVQRVFEAKGRPAADPIIIHVLGADDLGVVSPSAPALAYELAEAFWPGPLTLIVPRGSAVPKVVTAGLDSVAVRSPAHAVARALLEAFGRPIAAPSANPFGLTSPTTAEHVARNLGERVGMVLDGGPTDIGVESTVVDCRVDPPVVLRPGGVTLEQLAPWGATLAASAMSESDLGAAAASPGQMARHYAPRALLVLVSPLADDEPGAAPGPDAVRDGPEVAAVPDAGSSASALVGTADVGSTGPAVAAVLAAAARSLAGLGYEVGVLAAEEDEVTLGRLPGAVHVVGVGSIRAPETVAHGLFAALHELDGAGVGVILARSFGRDGLALAIEDRLTRAAEGRVIQVSPLPPEDNETTAADAAAAVVRLVERSGASGGPRDRPSSL